MVRFLIKRLLSVSLTLFAVSVVSFLMFFALPKDPVTGMCPKNCNAERLERVRQELGLRDPKVEQYAGTRTSTARRSPTPSAGSCR
jgi:peptide/nickel transport system permease protein